MSAQNTIPTATSLPASSEPVVELSRFIEFACKQPGGIAHVAFNFERAYCPHCGGVTGITYRNERGAWESISDPVLAQILSAAQGGYCLRSNQILAARGNFLSRDGHDGWPDDWQGVYVPKRCRCEETRGEQQ